MGQRYYSPLIGWWAEAADLSGDPSDVSRSRRRERQRGRGQSLAEFALSLPVFLVLTLAVTDGARAYMAQIALTNGVSEAALFALKGNYNAWCRNPSDPSQADASMPVSVPCPAGTTSVHYSADPGNLAYRVAADAGGMNPGSIVLQQPLCGLGPGAPALACSSVANPVYVTVKATYAFHPITPLLSQFWGGSVTLTASSTARVNM